MSAMACWASEENDAHIMAIRIIMMKAVNSIESIIVSATFTNEMEDIQFSSLSLETDGNTYSVPTEQLHGAVRVYPATIKVSSEVGNPYAGLGPYIYIRFDGYDGTNQAKYRVVFGPGGFKEIRKESIQQSGAAYPPQGVGSADP